MNILVIHGPNLNLLGEREHEIYGTQSLRDLNYRLQSWAKEYACTLKIYQYNYEGDIINCLHEQRNWAQGVVVNPAAFTHYSVAIRDAIAAIQIPTVEVHLTNIEKREEFRKVSVVKDVCKKQFMGKGFQSYIEGLMYLKEIL